MPTSTFRGRDAPDYLAGNEESPGAVKAALGKAFSMKRPVIIDAVTDIKAFAKRAGLPQGASSGH